MAVQAEYPTDIISPEHRNRYRQSNFLPSAGSSMEEFQQFQSGITAGASNQFRLFRTIASANNIQPTLNATMNGNDVGLVCNQLVDTRKRSREADNLLTNMQRHQGSINLELHQNHASSASILTPAGVSKRLALEANKINSTVISKSNRADNSNILSLLPDISSQLQQQKDEVELFIKVQGEQLRQMIEVKRQQFLTYLLGGIEERFSKRLRESALEVEKVNRRNMELEDRIKQLSMEAHLWQKQAKSNEALVTALRCNLQQAVALSKEQSKEGCGDSEDDDAASSHRDNSIDVHARAFIENRELKEQKTCRVCRCNDVCILLLPCRHLCLCKDCETRLDACPICRSTKNASVQVYMN